MPGGGLWADRTLQVVYCIFGLVEGLIAVRIVLNMVAGNPDSLFTRFIYAVTDPMVLPLPVWSAGTRLHWALFDVAAMVTLVGLVFLAWVVWKLFGLLTPGERY